MPTNLALDPKLLDQVLELSGEPTKKAAVTLALRAGTPSKRRVASRAPALSTIQARNAGVGWRRGVRIHAGSSGSRRGTGS